MTRDEEHAEAEREVDALTPGSPPIAQMPAALSNDIGTILHVPAKKKGK